MYGDLGGRPYHSEWALLQDARNRFRITPAGVAKAGNGVKEVIIIMAMKTGIYETAFFRVTSISATLELPVVTIFLCYDI